MERLTKKERVGLIAFSIIVAVGILITMLAKNLRTHDNGDNENYQTEIAEFERQVLEMESDTTESKTVKRKKKVKQKTVYKDINPLEEKNGEKAMKKQRALFATKIGVIAASVGSAIGLGNIWRFPYEAGLHGGGAFLLIYIVIVAVIGIPLICTEFVIGRASHKNVLGSLKSLQRKGSKWHYISYLGIISSLMILSFYSVVAGWTLEYSFSSLFGALADANTDYSAYFADFTMNSNRPLLWTVLFLFLNFLILRKGLRNGIERMSNIMTPMLFFILLVFCIKSLMMPGAIEGVKFLFVPDFSKIDSSVLLGAMGQAFFSLSLGVSTLLTYASYFNKDVPLVRSASIIAGLDTLFAIVSGLIIFPALFSFNIEPTEGPKLVFEVLPYIFSHMVGGQIWAAAFFFLLFVASITSTISMSEISIAFFTEEWNMSREKSSLLNFVIALVFGILCALSFGVMSDFTIFGDTIFDLFNNLTANYFMPICGMFFSIFAGWLLDKKILRNQLTNGGSRAVVLFKPIVFCMKFVAPLAVLLVFIYQLV